MEKEKEMGSRAKTEDKQEKITWQEACALLCRAAGTTDQEMCPADACLHRVLAEDVISPMDQPPFRRSAMDGYAVRSADIQNATLETPAILPVKTCLYAGDMPLPAGNLKEGEAIRIMTGAPVPDEADRVIRQEDTDEGPQNVRIFTDGGGWSNISPAGEDFAKGECLIRKGTLVDAYALSCVCAAGISRLPVQKKIRAGLIMTGNELCPPGQALQPGKIYNSNEAFLKGRLPELGGEVTAAVYAEDDREKITETIQRMKDETDLIITTGGVSVGERDLIPASLLNAGARILFHGIAVKPGMPTLGAVCGGIPVLGLSGNPYSAAAIFELLGGPLLFKMLGRREDPLVETKAVLACDVTQKGTLPRVMRGFYDGTKVYVPGKQRNAQMKFGIGSNCLLLLPAGHRVYTAGEEMKILLQR